MEFASSPSGGQIELNRILVGLGNTPGPPYESTNRPLYGYGGDDLPWLRPGETMAALRDYSQPMRQLIKRSNFVGGKCATKDRQLVHVANVINAQHDR